MADNDADAAFDSDEISALILKSKAQRAEFTFAFGLGSKAEDCALIMHMRKPGKALKGEVKALPGKIGKACFGTFGVVENEIRFLPARPVKGMIKQLKKRLRDAGMAKWKPVLVGPDGMEIDEDTLPDDEGLEEDDDNAVADVAPPEPLDLSPLKRRLAALIRSVQALPEGDVATRLMQACRIAAQQVAQEQAEGADKTIASIEAALDRQKPQGEGAGQPEGEAPPAAPPAPQVPPARLQEALTGLVQRIRAISDQTVQGGLANQAREIMAMIRDGASDQAVAALRTLAADVAKAEKGGDSGGPSAGGAKAMEVWTSARETVDRGIEKLQSKIRGFGDPDLDRIAEFGLNGVTNGVQTRLMAALFDYQRNAGPATAEALRKRAQEARGMIESDAVIALCDENPFGVSLSIRSTLGAALSEIERLAA